MAPDNGSDSVRSVARALSLLALFDEEHAIRPLRELVEAAELPKTTVLRLIQTMEQLGYLHTRADGRYCLGPALIRLSRAVGLVWRLPQAADAGMSALREQSQETVNLYVLEGQSRVCVAQKEGRQNIRYVVPVGVPLPLWGGASAKVLLADGPPNLIDGALRAGNKDATYRARFLEELERVRRDGLAVSHGEREPGASSVASPLRAGGHTIAAVAISGPTSRFTPQRVAELAALLREAVGRMEQSFAKDMTGEPPGAAWEVRGAAR
jgi:DNA-binding IclR family transcriptional regulator